MSWKTWLANIFQCQEGTVTADLAHFDSSSLNGTVILLQFSLFLILFLLWSLHYRVPINCVPRAEGLMPSSSHTANCENFVHEQKLADDLNYTNLTQWRIIHESLTFHPDDWWCIHTHCGEGSWHSLQPKVFHQLLQPGLGWHTPVCNKSRREHVTNMRRVRRALISETRLCFGLRQTESLWYQSDYSFSEEKSYKPKRLIWKSILS